MLLVIGYRPMKVDFSDFHTWGDVSAILTCLFVIVGYGRYQLDLRKKSKRLERHLANDRKQHTILHIIRYVGLTEEEIIKISFRNKHVGRVVHVASSGKADELLFEYVP